MHKVRSTKARCNGHLQDDQAGAKEAHGIKEERHQITLHQLGARSITGKGGTLEP